MKRLAPYFTSSVIDFDPKLEGSRNKGDRLVLGGRAGPSSSFSNLAHEMAHLVEIDDARAHMDDWGLRLGTWRSLAGHNWREFRTSEPMRRELRVGAYQWAIHEFFGEDTREKFVRDYAALMSRFMPFDTVCIFADEQGEPGQLRACTDYLNELIDSGDGFEAFEYEWGRKVALLEEHFARRVAA